MKLAHEAELPVYLTGASNDYTAAAAEADLYGRLGLLLQPGTLHHAAHIPSYVGGGWAMDNGCFSSKGKFDGSKFCEDLDRIIQTIDGAHDSIRFAVAPDVFDVDKMEGDPIGTLERSSKWFDKIRATGAPVAFVFQDGLEQWDFDSIPWDDFDVAFIGGSDAFKLGYPDKRVNGNPHYLAGPLGAQSDRTQLWAALMAEVHARGKGLHVGRVSSRIRLTFGYEIGADSADGTFIKFGGRKNLERVRQWYDGLSQGAELALAELAAIEDERSAA